MTDKNQNGRQGFASFTSAFRIPSKQPEWNSILLKFIEVIKVFMLDLFYISVQV